jgi:hypothetical protein
VSAVCRVSCTVVPYSQADCPHPLKFNPHGSVAVPSVSLTADEQICVYPCPDPMFDASDWRASEGISISLGSTHTHTHTHAHTHAH